MALPLLVNGADCGPANPLQGLSKQLDRDRGLQQDHFGAGRAGSSKEVFRSQYTSAPGVDQDAARFFQASSSGSSIAPAPFDLSLLNNALPSTSSHSQPIHPSASWASDFMQQAPVMPASQDSFSQGFQPQLQPALASPTYQEMNGLSSPASPGTWAPAFMNRTSTLPFQQPFVSMGSLTPQVMEAPQPPIYSSQWEEAFSTHESLTTAPEKVAETSSRQPGESDELARAAGSLIQAVQHEQNPKFKNSAFLGLMQQIRDHEVTVEGDKMVPADGVSSQGINGWASEFQASSDVKGKGKAVDRPAIVGGNSSLLNAATVQPTTVSQPLAEALRSAEDDIDEYFRKENEAYIQYHSDPKAAERNSAIPAALSAQHEEWDRLQNDWSRFEATATGLRPVANYQFAQNNPYLHSETSRHHLMHSQKPTLSLYESVLQMEAAVQRDPNNVDAWYSLGVKQQENEREAKAIHALRRALELDPNHLPSWVALAISHTNEGNRSGAFEAIQAWVNHNERYGQAVDTFRAHSPERDDMTQQEKFAYLTDCLIHMSRSAGDDIDADIQIALAVLMNTNEAYDKAKDCFLIALAMRPEDPQLYNRVGATLANSGQASDALEYYYKALELNPAYIRARFNLGISCINLRRYQEASSHILDALALQESDAVRNLDGTDDKRGVTSTALWDSLKTCCLHLRRLDLASLCDRRDLEAFQLNYQIA